MKEITRVRNKLFKYETIKMCLDRVLNEYEEPGEGSIGLFGQNELSLSFKIAFNTLIKYQILMEDDE